jgi:F0F1-type ATP synthase assembly protein I
MTKTTAPDKTPSPTPLISHQPDSQPNPTTMFLGAVMDMSWRLAIVVLIPIVGGFKVDEKLKTSPIFVIVGFLLAMAGTGYVLWWASKQTMDLSSPKGSK